jgi:hypothetical protein
MRLSLEIVIVAGADVFQTTEGRVAAPQWPGVTIPPGSENRARSRGFSRNLGGPFASTAGPGRRYRVTNSRSEADALGGLGSEMRVQPGTAKRRRRSAAGRAKGIRSAS